MAIRNSKFLRSSDRDERNELVTNIHKNMQLGKKKGQMKVTKIYLLIRNTHHLVINVEFSYKS